MSWFGRCRGFKTHVWIEEYETVEVMYVLHCKRGKVTLWRYQKPKAE
jgi:hypothetical protein